MTVNKVLLIVFAVIVAVWLAVAAVLSATNHCGGRGCINQIPSPRASVTR